MPYKQIFWDCDGTLVDTEPAFFKATQQVLSKEGLELTIDWWTGVHLATGKSSFDLLLDQGVDRKRVQQLREERNLLYQTSLSREVVIMDGIREVLDSLHQRVPMSVVTSSLRSNNDHIVDAKNLRKYFDFIIAREDFDEDKPDPACYLQAYDRVPHDREQCLVIEDTQRGVQAAKAAGLICFVIPNKYTLNHDFSMADRILDHPRDLLECFSPL
ncbi:MAG: HAD family phosphatase [Candidatus Gracilibacteria bacterium]|nr:HAD family phosphatase [Candidatus Gracilibacteria bacterium]